MNNNHHIQSNQPTWLKLRLWALRNLPILPKVRRTYHVDHLKRCLKLPAKELSPDSFL